MKLNFHSKYTSKLLSFAILTVMLPGILSAQFKYWPEQEPNNTAAQANALSAQFVNTQTDMVEAKYNSATDVDWFSFNVDKAGKYLLGNSFTYPDLELYSASNLSTPIEQGWYLTPMLSPGKYYIKVSASQHTVGKTYLFEVSPTK